MNCTRCGQPAGYNRAVVDTLSGRELGGFCRNCELAEFGRALEQFTQSGGNCAVCNRDGHFALPAWTARPEPREDIIVSTVEYTIGARTPRLCDEHFEDFLSEGGPHRAGDRR